jgi:hypothetical protein
MAFEGRVLTRAINLLLSAPARAEQTETRIISKGQLWSVRARGGLEVKCKRGSIWITGGPEDVVLEAGQRKIFRSRFPVVMEALSLAEIAIEHFD